MAYQFGDLILDDHYNGFANDTNTVLSTGSGDTGYGQPAISTVAASQVITATQWSTLLSKIQSLADHQGTSLNSITNPVAGDIISAFGTISSNITLVQQNRLSVNGFSADQVNTRSRTSHWFQKVTMLFTASFANTDSARFFFNAGGQLRYSFSRSGGTTSDKNTQWAGLCQSVGTFTLKAQQSTTSSNGVVTIMQDLIGWHDLTGTNQILFKQFEDTSPYTTNYIQISARKSNADIIFTIEFVDDAVDTTFEPWNLDHQTHDRVDGTLTTTQVVRPPFTTHLADVWGAPSVSSSESSTLYG